MISRSNIQNNLIKKEYGNIMKNIFKERKNDNLNSSQSLINRNESVKFIEWDGMSVGASDVGGRMTGTNNPNILTARTRKDNIKEIRYT